MSLFDILLLAVALAMDCFTVSIVSGVLAGARAGTPPRAGSLLRLSLLFGLFQGLMPLLGWAGISRFSRYLETVDHWIAFGLLAFIGGNMIREALTGDDEQRRFDPYRLPTQLLLAVATSIDALAVGISMACTGYDRLPQLVLPLTVIGLVSLLFSRAGYWLGLRFGRNSLVERAKPELFGGLILLFIGTKILIAHLA